MKKGHRFKNSVLFRFFCCKTLALMAVYLFFRCFLGWYRVNIKMPSKERAAMKNISTYNCRFSRPTVVAVAFQMAAALTPPRKSITAGHRFAPIPYT